MNRVSLIYILNKSGGIGVQKRDFYEKKISFKTTAEDGSHKYYFYFSSIEDEVRMLECRILIGTPTPA